MIVIITTTIFIIINSSSSSNGITTTITLTGLGRFLGAARAATLDFGRTFGCFDQTRFLGRWGVDHGIEIAARLGLTRRLDLTRRFCLNAAITVARLIWHITIGVGRPVALPLAVTAPTLLGLELLTRFLLALRFGQHAQVMLGMLLEILGGDAVIAELRIAGELVVFLDDLLRCAADLALGAGRVEYAVDDIADRAIAVPLGPRAVLR